jgi:hypothetical protein
MTGKTLALSCASLLILLKKFLPFHMPLKWRWGLAHHLPTTVYLAMHFLLISSSVLTLHQKTQASVPTYFKATDFFL